MYIILKTVKLVLILEILTAEVLELYSTRATHFLLSKTITVITSPYYIVIQSIRNDI